jgi:hypothetical protein
MGHAGPTGGGRADVPWPWSSVLAALLRWPGWRPGRLQGAALLQACVHRGCQGGGPGLWSVVSSARHPWWVDLASRRSSAHGDVVSLVVAGGAAVGESQGGAFGSRLWSEFLLIATCFGADDLPRLSPHRRGRGGALGESSTSAFGWVR